MIKLGSTPLHLSNTRRVITRVVGKMRVEGCRSGESITAICYSGSYRRQLAMLCNLNTRQHCILTGICFLSVKFYWIRGIPSKLNRSHDLTFININPKFFRLRVTGWRFTIACTMQVSIRIAWKIDNKCERFQIEPSALHDSGDGSGVLSDLFGHPDIHQCQTGLRGSSLTLPRIKHRTVNISTLLT